MKNTDNGFPILFSISVELSSHSEAEKLAEKCNAETGVIWFAYKKTAYSLLDFTLAEAPSKIEGISALSGYHSQIVLVPAGNVLILYANTQVNRTSEMRGSTGASNNSFFDKALRGTAMFGPSGGAMGFF